MTDAFHITEQAIDLEQCRHRVLSASCGGYASFEGWVRDHNDGRRVASLEYEAYPALANKEGLRILQEARERFPIEAVAAVHRVGRLALGDVAVWVGVASAHRDAAFSACRFVIDELKHRVPIWKREHYVEGPSEWVNCAACAHPPGVHHDR